MPSCHCQLFVEVSLQTPGPKGLNVATTPPAPVLIQAHSRRVWSGGLWGGLWAGLRKEGWVLWVPWPRRGSRREGGRSPHGTSLRLGGDVCPLLGPTACSRKHEKNPAAGGGIGCTPGPGGWGSHRRGSRMHVCVSWGVRTPQNYYCLHLVLPSRNRGPGEARGHESPRVTPQTLGGTKEGRSSMPPRGFLEVWELWSSPCSPSPCPRPVAHLCGDWRSPA